MERWAMDRRSDDALEPAACYGLACPRRGQCERFSALGLEEGHTIDSCQTREGWPLFAPIHPLDELARIDRELGL